MSRTTERGLPWHTSRASRTCCVQLIQYATIGLRISGYGAADVFIDFAEELSIRKPIRCVKFTKAVVRHADIRDQNPSLGYICPGEPHLRSPSAPKFVDRSQEETEWQEQGAREAAWKLAKMCFLIKGEKQSNILLTFGK